MVIKTLIYFESAYKNNLFKIKGFLLRQFLIAHGCKVGSKLRCHCFPVFRTVPWKNIIIGQNVTIGYNITFEILQTGKLIIGDYVKLTQNILVASGSEIRIGDYSLFGENVSIRDGDHNTSIQKSITFQTSTFSPVYIGKDVWIGAGCFILKGSIIPDGVIIGANSVVLKDIQLKRNTIYAGSPVKEIGVRGES
jgi:acetyltransferase-like isoleucine patch superfamily enzyme